MTDSCVLRRQAQLEHRRFTREGASNARVAIANEGVAEQCSDYFVVRGVFKFVAPALRDPTQAAKLRALGVAADGGLWEEANAAAAVGADDGGEVLLRLPAAAATSELIRRIIAAGCRGQRAARAVREFRGRAPQAVLDEVVAAGGETIRLKTYPSADEAPAAALAIGGPADAAAPSAASAPNEAAAALAPEASPDATTIPADPAPPIADALAAPAEQDEATDAPVDRSAGAFVSPDDATAARFRTAPVPPPTLERDKPPNPAGDPAPARWVAAAAASPENAVDTADAATTALARVDLGMLVSPTAAPEDITPAPIAAAGRVGAADPTSDVIAEPPNTGALAGPREFAPLIRLLTRRSEGGGAPPGDVATAVTSSPDDLTRALAEADVHPIHPPAEANKMDQPGL